MSKTMRRSRWRMLAIAALTLTTGLTFGIKASAEGTVYTNPFEDGRIETRFEISEKNLSQFHNNYIFNDPNWAGQYAYLYQNSANTATSSLNVGSTSGLALGNQSGATFNLVTGVNPTFTVSQVNGRNQYKGDAYLVSGAYKVHYVVTTTTDEFGEIKHDVELTNAGTAPLPAEGLVMHVDTELYGVDRVPLYAVGDNQKNAYMYLADLTTYQPIVHNGKKLRFDLKANSGIENMYAGRWNRYTTTKVNVADVDKDEPLTYDAGYTGDPGSDHPSQYYDSAVFYEIAGSKGLAVGDTINYSYSEKLTLFAAGNTEYYDENGNVIYRDDRNENEVYEAHRPIKPILPPIIPGYTFSYAEAVYLDEDGVTPTDEKVNMLYTDEAHTDANRYYRSSLNPVVGLAPTRPFRVKLIYRPVNNLGSNAGVNTNTTPNNNTNGNTNTTPNNNTNGNTNTNTTPNGNPETDKNAGSAVKLPSTAAKKGEAIYAVNKLGLYKGVNFTNSSRIKTYAKRTRVNRPEFIVKGYAYSKNGALRYLVQQYNPYTNKYVAGTKGYITASRKYVMPVYVKTTGTKRIKVINANGIKAYSNKQLTNYKKSYKKGTTLKVKKVVKQKYATRFQLTNGLYVTANKKFVMFK